MKNIKWNFVLIGLAGLLFEVNRLYLKLYVFEDFRIGTLPSFFYDGILGFIIISIEILILFLLIMYSLGFKNKFTKIGEFVISTYYKIKELNNKK